MPQIDLITPVKYDSGWPYDSAYDNLPITQILARIDLVNLAVDQNEEILRNAQGTAGTLSNRLNQSIAEDGNLLDTAVDQALHNIGAHTDGSYEGTDYVRMTLSERDKLDLIADNASALRIQFDTISTISTVESTVLFENETLEIQNSDTIKWLISAPNVVKANLAFPVTAAHEHYYDLIPVHTNLMTPDYTSYKVNSSATEYIDGSLRVHINGIRISEATDTYVYNADDGPSGTWDITNFTSDSENGLFTLNRAIDPSDVITIDFDRSFI